MAAHRARSARCLSGRPVRGPQGAERAEQLASVLEVIYLVFNEGYSATAGED